MPCPTNTASASMSVSVCCVWLTPTKSSSQRSGTLRPGEVAASRALSRVSTPTIGTRWKYVPLSPAGRAPASANWVAMYSVASSPPRAPTPRPSRRSLARNFTWARMRSAERSCAASEHTPARAITTMSMDFGIIQCYPVFTVDKLTVTHLRALEAESIFILREVVAEFARPVMLYSIGKDSSVMLRLAQKAFYPGPIPFPLLHIDTTYKFREMIEFRDRFCREIGARLIVHTNRKALEEGADPVRLGTQKCCGLLKTRALLDG